MNKSPLVSVILPVYNCERYLQQAIESILNQTYKNFELIIVSEFGTNDDSLTIIRSFTDRKITHIHNETRRGLIESLNVGIKKGTGKYIARMDADDISSSTRFEMQVEFMENNPDIGVLGTWAEMVGADGNVIGHIEHPTDHSLIKWSLFFNSSIVSSTSMFRRTIYEQAGGYGPSIYGEDYELWLRAVAITKLANLPNKLGMYRIHNQSATRTYPKEMLQSAPALSQKAISGTLKKEVPMRTIIAIQEPETIQNVEDAMNSCAFLEELYEVYILDNNLSSTEKDLILHNIAIMTYDIMRPFGRDNFQLFVVTTLNAINRIEKFLFKIKIIFDLMRLSLMGLIEHNPSQSTGGAKP